MRHCKNVESGEERAVKIINKARMSPKQMKMF